MVKIDNYTWWGQSSFWILSAGSRGLSPAAIQEMHEGQHTFSHLLRWNFPNSFPFGCTEASSEGATTITAWASDSKRRRRAQTLLHIVLWRAFMSVIKGGWEKAHQKSLPSFIPAVFCVIQQEVWFVHTWTSGGSDMLSQQPGFWVCAATVIFFQIPRSPVLASPRSVLQHASLGARRPVRRRLMTARSAGQSMVVGALMRDELKS